MKLLPAILLMLCHPAAFGQWVHRTDVGNPGQRTAFAMAYDKDRGVTVFFGGEIGDGGDETFYHDTWEYDGSHWQQIAITGPVPDTRSGSAMCYDTVRHQMILAGGVNEDGYLRDTWTYKPTGPQHGQWTRRVDLPAVAIGFSPGVAGHAMYFDEAAGVAVLTGGSSLNTLWAAHGWDARKILYQILTFDGTSWSSVPVNMIHGLTRHAMAYDSAHHRVVILGGNSFAHSPTFQQMNDATFDPEQPHYLEHVSGEISTIEISRWPLEIRGYGSGPAFLDNGTQQSAMAYDQVRDRFVIFGGQNGDRPYADRTQELKGFPEYYTQPPGYYPVYGNTLGDPYHRMQDLQLALHPPARAGHAMVYDARRRVTVLYGGASGSTRFDDTWELITAPATGPVWVDTGFQGGGNFGTPDFPFQSLQEALAAHAGGDLLLKGPRVSSQRITITRPMTLRAVGGAVVLGQP